VVPEAPGIHIRLSGRWSDDLPLQRRVCYEVTSRNVYEWLGILIWVGIILVVVGGVLLLGTLYVDSVLWDWACWCLLVGIMTIAVSVVGRDA
jgi:hypothetical protein